MEITFSQLKQKDVINLNDGKNLGKVCDITVCFPEAGFIGITVTGCKGFKFSKQDIFIPVQNIVKIGEDAVLVKTREKDKCPPPVKPDKCAPPCPPPYPPPCPPHGGRQQPPPDRRSYDEYE